MKWYKSFYQYFYKYEKWCKICLFLLLSITLLLALITYPYISDDFIYSKQWNSNLPLADIKDILIYQWHHYFSWGGRTVAHTIVQLLFLLKDPWASVLTLCIYLGLVYMIMAFLTNHRSVYLYFIGCACLYFLNPEFKETILWRTGAGNYLWTTFLILLSMQPLKKIFLGKKIEMYDYFFWLISFFSGWTNENMAPIIIGLNVYILYYAKRKRNFQSYLYLIGNLICLCCGSCLLIFAPGNVARSNTFQKGLLAVAYRGHGQINAWFNWLFMAWILLLITYYILYTMHINVNYFAKIISLSAIFSSLIMIFSPSYPSRATFGTLVLICIVLCSNLEKIFVNDKKIERIIGILCCIAFIGSMLSLGILQLVRNMGVNIPG